MNLPVLCPFSAPMVRVPSEYTHSGPSGAVTSTPSSSASLWATQGALPSCLPVEQASSLIGVPGS